MADGRRSHTARPEEISYMDDDVSEFDPNVPNNDMDARLFRLLSNPAKTDLSKRQPLPRDRSLGLRIPSARFARGLDLHKGESHGPVPALVTSPVHDHADDIVGLRPASEDPHATNTPSRATPPAGGYAQAPNSDNGRASTHYDTHAHGGGSIGDAGRGEPYIDTANSGNDTNSGGNTYDSNAFDRAVDGGSAPASQGADSGRDHAHQFVVGFDDAHTASGAYGDGGHYAGDYPHHDEGPDAFSLAVQEAQHHAAVEHDSGGMSGQANAWPMPFDGAPSAGAGAWGESDAAQHNAPVANNASGNDHAWFGAAEAAAMATGAHDGEAQYQQQHQQQRQDAPTDAFSSAYPPSLSTASMSPRGNSDQDAGAYHYPGEPAYDRRESYAPQSHPGPSSPRGSSSSTFGQRPEPSSSYGAGAAAHDPYAEERKAKHAALLNLAQIEESGGVLSRKFTMDDPYDEIEYELDAYHHRRNHIQSIEMVHDKLNMVENVILLVNCMGGRLLKRREPIIAPTELKKAWRETIDKHKVVIENVARKRYGPHAGSSAQSPEIQLGTALAMGIGGPILMSLCMNYLMGGGGAGDSSASSASGDRSRGEARQRRRRDDSRPALRRHRDAASGSDWREGHNNNGAGAYPEPPQDPFSRVPSLHTPQAQQETSWTSPGVPPPPVPLQQQQQQHAHTGVDSTGSAVTYASPHTQPNWAGPIAAAPHAPSGGQVPRMDPYGHATSSWPHTQSYPTGDYQHQQHQYPQQSFHPQQYQQHQQPAPLYTPQNQQAPAYAPQTHVESAHQYQQRQHPEPTPHGAGGERVAHTHAAPVAARVPDGAHQAHYEAAPRQQPHQQQQTTPSGGAPQGRRLMGRIAKPR
ncbi:hypothetical protein pneo_cds_274 [Pandoravirus neocaledonia]|uniref:Uncharacterized protein n=1 Tax=Pandoravirus neocaledonia TaxID=2107708 RepID=A0A2U7UBN8_9VIRU|nr:hypothetical protein pneo_cds_274 [Pandoravirus neocaledonia]AVK75881.1 hypothetical protein pneo_cds_274 [Pandoravirus neocaledonia]